MYCVLLSATEIYNTLFLIELHLANLLQRGHFHTDSKFVANLPCNVEKFERQTYSKQAAKYRANWAYSHISIEIYECDKCQLR